MDHLFGGGISFRISIDPDVESASPDSIIRSESAKNDPDVESAFPDSIIRSESATPHVCLRLGMVTTCLFSGPVGFGPYGPKPNRPRLGDPTWVMPFGHHPSRLYIGALRAPA